jgi:hypothetical protein
MTDKQMSDWIARNCRFAGMADVDHVRIHELNKKLNRHYTPEMISECCGSSASDQIHDMGGEMWGHCRACGENARFSEEGQEPPF